MIQCWQREGPSGEPGGADTFLELGLPHPLSSAHPPSQSSKAGAGRGGNACHSCVCLGPFDIDYTLISNSILFMACVCTQMYDSSVLHPRGWEEADILVRVG